MTQVTRRNALRLGIPVGLGLLAAPTLLVPSANAKGFELTGAGMEALRASLAAGGQILPDRIIGPEGHVTDGGFFSRWMELGPQLGLMLYGWPISDLFDENLEVGGGATKSFKVQYFERVRMEYHPEFQSPHHILLGQFGREILNFRKGGGGGGVPAMKINGPVPAGAYGGPGDLESLRRIYLDRNAPLNEWVHLIFDNVAYGKSGGYEGQMSWHHNFKGLQLIGCYLTQFARNDGSFRIRMVAEDATAAFAIHKEARWKDQFTGGGDVVTTVNIRTMGGAPIRVIHPGTGAILWQGNASPRGGDIEFLMPDQGHVAFQVGGQDPAKSFEYIVWFGIKNRPEVAGQTIYTVDVRDKQF